MNTGAEISVEQDQDRLNTILDSYESIHGLSVSADPGNPEGLNKYLTMGRDQLQALNISDCAEIAYILAEYAFYIQKLYNKESSTLIWAEKKLSEYTCSKLDQYDKYMKYEAKINCIAKENSAVNKIINIIAYCKQVMERLNFLSTKMHNLADKLNNLQIAKTSQAKVNRYE